MYLMTRYAMVVWLVSTASVVAEDLVRVPDANLRTAVYEARRREVKDGEMVPKELLTGLYYLDANGRDIADLTGMEHCINLGEARLGGNRIQNVSPLAACTNLQSLTLSENQITDISPLGKIGRKLQYLNIEHNRVESLQGIETLESLNSLYASHNKISDLKPVSGLKKLWTLQVNHNQVKDISAVASLPRVDTLGLAHNQIEDVSPLPPGSSMYTTYLQGNRIRDIEPLVKLARDDVSGPRRFAPFWKLYLAGNPLSEESLKVHIPELQKLGVRVDLTYDK